MLNLNIQLRKALFVRLQPVPLIVLGPAALDDVKGVGQAALERAVRLRLVQDVAVDEHQVAGLDLAGDVVGVGMRIGPLAVLVARREPRPVVGNHLGADVPRLPHEPIRNGRPAVRSRQEAQAAVLERGVLEGVPETHSRGRVSEEECRVLNHHPYQVQSALFIAPFSLYTLTLHDRLAGVS